jgi:hypothetical protein
MTDLTIPADLSIPPFLSLKDPDNLAAWKEGRKSWTPRRIKAEAKALGNRDAEGRGLPRSMDAGSWALLRSIEKASKTQADEDKAERFRLLAVARAEKAEVKAAAKAAKNKP